MMAKICSQCPNEIPKTRGNNAKTCCEECGKERRAKYMAEYKLEYEQRPEVKAHRAEYRAEHRQCPDVKERKAEYSLEYEQRPEVKERKAEYMAEYRRDLKQHRMLCDLAALQDMEDGTLRVHTGHGNHVTVSKEEAFSLFSTWKSKVF